MITRTTVEYLSEWWIMCLSTTFRNLYNYMCMSGGQNYFLPAMDMAKVGGPFIGCEGFRTNLNIPSPLPTTSVSCKFCPLLLYMEVSWTGGTKYHPCYVCFFHNMGKTIINHPNHHRRYKPFPNGWFIIVLTCFNHIIINHPFILGYISMTMDTSFGASLKSTWNWSESAFTPVMRPMAWDLWWEKPSKSHGLLWGINNFHGLSSISILFLFKLMKVSMVYLTMLARLTLLFQGLSHIYPYFICLTCFNVYLDKSVVLCRILKRVIITWP